MFKRSLRGTAACIVFFFCVAISRNVGAAEARQPASIPKAELAKDQAKEAELTPIVPSPKDITKPAYQLFAEVDLPLLGIGLVLGLARLIRTQPAFCAPQCDSADLNVIDRTTAGFYDHNWGIGTDIGMYGLIAASAGLLFGDEGFLPALNDLVVVAESGMIATSLASLATLAVGRPRPYLYGDKAPLAKRNGADAGLSFLSSHAAVSFSIAVSTYMTMRRLHADMTTVLPLVTLLVGLGVSVFVASGRVMGGMHFITDVVGGAIIGSAVGILIPSLHASPVKVVPKVRVTSDSASIDLIGMF